MKRLILLIIVLLISIQVFAGVVTAKELADMMKSENVVVVSARNPSDYASKHITGAINLYPNDLYAAEGVEAMLKPVAEIAKILGETGISADSKIVIYDDGSNKAAGRLYWILKYMGAKDMSILDGHIKSWMKARKPVTAKATEVAPVTFNASVNENIYASMDYVRSHLADKGVLLVDVRSPEEFMGKNEDEKLKRKGHIPGAINFNYVQLLNEDETLKSKEEIAALLKSANITSDKEIILYCATSVRAGIVYVALTSLLDYPQVRVYDGAFYEWDSDSSNLVE
ncbi:MAG: sulfurtransferase [Candidatus Cloacimonetes bacterium]|nr:sulfurtransferase [Candidatus Cloacimonadota bacterium]